MGSLLGLLWSFAAFAGGPENWSSAYDARLSQAMGAKPSDAIAIYEALIAQIPQGEEQQERFSISGAPDGRPETSRVHDES